MRVDLGHTKHANTSRVCFQHHVMTHDVFNAVMKTVGERIRQAREFRGLSGEELALKVGYKTQSGISNLENRATGRGGFMLPKIAEALDVSVEWLLQGPDTNNMQEVAPFSQSARTPESIGHAGEPVTPYTASIRSQAHAAIDRISEAGLVYALELLEGIAVRHPATQKQGAGLFVPANQKIA